MLIDRVIKAIGSWTSLILMGAAAVAWASWNRYKSHSQDGLDLAISIWTMLMDAVVIISMNHSAAQSELTTKKIVAMLEAGVYTKPKKPDSGGGP
jgi:hypothetical protein